MARAAAAPAAPAEAPITRAELESLYKEMIAVMQPDPPFPAITRKTTDQQIIDIILKEAEGNVYTTDMTEDPENPNKVIYTEAAENLLLDLGVAIVEPPEEGEEAPEPEPAPAPAPAAPARAARGAAAPAPAAPAPAPARQARGAAPAPAPAPAPAAPAGRAARGAAPAPAPAAPARAARGAAAPAPAAPTAAPKPAKAPKAPAAPKNAAYTRSVALAEAIKVGGTKEQIVQNSDAYYVEEGGESNLTVAEAMFRYGVPLLKELGFISVDASGVFALAVAAE